MRSHVHRGANQNLGNQIGSRSSVGQTRNYRCHESGNTMKGLLGHDDLRWDVDRKQGAYSGPVRGAHPEHCSSSSSSYKPATSALHSGGGGGGGGGGSGGAAPPTYPKGTRVHYIDGQKNLLEAEVVSVHHDDDPPYYTIRLFSTGREKQTVGNRLRPIKGNSSRGRGRPTPQDAGRAMPAHSFAPENAQRGRVVGGHGAIRNSSGGSNRWQTSNSAYNGGR